MSVTVQLLLGEIPDRGVFREAVLRKPLQPYLQLVQGVKAFLVFGIVSGFCDMVGDI